MSVTMFRLNLKEGNREVGRSAWTGRTTQIFPARSTTIQRIYPQTTYFEDLNLTVTHRRTGAKGTAIVKTLPPEYIEKNELLAMATDIYNRAWNPANELWAGELFSITLEQFKQMYQNSPGGIIAVFVDGKLAGMICALNLEFEGKEVFPKTYDAIVTPQNYFGQNRSYANAKHCVAVLIHPVFLGFRTDHEFSLKGEKKQLSLGQVLVLAQMIEARRSPYIIYQFADSRCPSLENYIPDKELGSTLFTEDGSVYTIIGDGQIKLLPTEQGLFLENGEPFLTFEEYFAAERAPDIPYDQMNYFHGVGLGGKTFAILPHGRRRVLSDGRVIIDQDALGFNVIYRFDPVADFEWFFRNILPHQRKFVTTLAKYMQDPSSIKGIDMGLREMFKYIDAPEEFAKTVIAGTFSIEKTRAIRERLLQDNLYKEVVNWPANI